MRASLLVIAIIAQLSLLAQQPDKVLTKKLQDLVKDFNGGVGIYVRHLQSGKTVAINADSIFPTASMIKIPITIGVFNKIENGVLNYDSILTYHDSLLYEVKIFLALLRAVKKYPFPKY